MNSLKNSDISGTRILVLVVDVDNDIGREGFSTPIVGYENVKNLALNFGIKKPQDSDLNALFAALRIYELLKNKGYSLDIAVIAGDEKNPVEAFVKINKEIEIVKKITGFTHIYFVSDGADDERILPILSSHGGIIGVERVVVEQSRGIEETYILLGRYIKKALTEQPYTRFFLGIPGLILIAYVIVSLMGFIGYIWEITALIIGITMFIKGFGIIDHVMNYWKISPLIGIMLFLSLVLFSYAFLVGLIVVYSYGFTVIALKLIVNMTSLPFVLGVMVLFSARIFYKVLKGMPNLVWRDALLMVPLIFFMVFINNFNNELAKIEDNASFSKVLELLNIQYVSIPLLLTVILSIVIALLFVILDVLLGERRV